jgi:hypothetical protein
MRYSGPRQLLLTLAIPKSAMADPADIEEVGKDSNWSIRLYLDSAPGYISP